MRSFSRVMVLAVALGAVFSLGCSDGDKPKTDAGVTDARARSDAKTTDGGAVATNCLGTADQAALQKSYGDGGGKTITDISTACGLACITAVVKKTCAEDCIANASKNALSTTCNGCFGARLACTIENCIGACAQNPTGAACAACGCGENTAKVNCVKQFETCSGMVSATSCPAAADGGMQDGAVSASDAAVSAADAAMHDAAMGDGA
ncbi:MAG: hypothetical protein IPL40_07235 [Proteobacteria bacterium]|nr:hypothetical protein [Pseudomonadota bacterium]